MSQVHFKFHHGRKTGVIKFPVQNGHEWWCENIMNQSDKMEPKAKKVNCEFTSCFHMPNPAHSEDVHGWMEHQRPFV